MRPQARLFTVISTVLVLFVVFAFQAPPAHADGLVVVNCPPVVIPFGTPNPIPLPQPAVPPIRRDCPNYLAVKNHNVTVTIENQVARTHVDETFFNDSAYSLEGTYIFPLPDDATISDFAMWVDGKKLEGQVLDQNQARQIYEDIVRRQRDPALLEYVGRNAFQARIFPIPPQSTKRVEIDYAQILKAESGLVRYVYPLNTEKFSPKPLGSVSINVSIKSNAALKAIYSPSHNVSTTRDGNFRARVGYEDSNVTPDRDFVLYYSVTQDSIGLNLMSFKAGNDDGFFVMLLAPQVEVDKSQVIARDVVLVLDVSGSMQGAKIAQAKNAIYYVLDHLNPNDRFNIISFSTGTSAYASSPQPASKRDDARNFVSRLQAEGSTDINRALLEALANVNTPTFSGPARPATLIFLTDGLPTTGEINSDKIIANAVDAAASARNARLFTFGVGDDVNTILLDTLAEKLGGTSAYVRPTEKIDEVVSAFYAKVSTPVLSDVTVDFGATTVSDLYPYPLPDLFAGSQLVVAGRYRTGGPTTVTLKGMINGVPQSFKYTDVSFNRAGGDDYIPRLWATRKIGYLLNEIRLHGESKEVVNDIVTLAVRYGIVTPYTSFLVDERSDVLTQSGRSDVAKKAETQFAPSAMPSTGAGAVQQSQDQNLLRGAAVAPAMPTAAPAAPRAGSAGQAQVAQAPIQVIGDKTFLLRAGVWNDSQFDPSKMTTTKIEFESDAYFALGASDPAFGKYLALGSRVIVVLNGAAYEITDNGTGASDAGAVPTTPPQPTGLKLPAPSTPTVPANLPSNVVNIERNTFPSLLELVGVSMLGLAILGGGGLIAVIALRKK